MASFPSSLWLLLLLLLLLLPLLLSPLLPPLLLPSPSPSGAPSGFPSLVVEVFLGVVLLVGLFGSSSSSEYPSWLLMFQLIPLFVLLRGVLETPGHGCGFVCSGCHPNGLPPKLPNPVVVSTGHPHGRLLSDG